MKKILILILIVILGIFGYNEYQDYQRYHPKNTDYNVPDDIDIHYFDKEMVYDYFQAVENLNSYVRLQWSANRVDVIHPEEDNNEINAALETYSKKMAKVKYYEAKLRSSTDHKNNGLSNKDIVMMADFNMTAEEYLTQKKNKELRNKMLSNFPQFPIRLGQRNAYIYEVQKILKAKGYKMPLDGVFKTVTSNAIKDFEVKNNLYPDGILDRITLEALLK